MAPKRSRRSKKCNDFSSSGEILYLVRARLNKRLLCRLYFLYSYRCRRGNCALNHLQNAVDCLCFKEIQKCVESLEAPLYVSREAANLTQQQDV